MLFIQKRETIFLVFNEDPPPLNINCTLVIWIEIDEIEFDYPTKKVYCNKSSFKYLFL